MNWSLFLITLLPLVVFVILDLRGSPRAAVIGAIVTSIGFLVLSYFMFGGIDGIGIAEVLLFIVLGFISLRLNNSRFFKFQPVVVGVLIGLILLYSQVLHEPFLVRMLPMLQKLQPDIASQLDQPRFRELLARASLYLIPTFLGHAAILAYTAMRCSNWVWIATRVAIYPLMLVTMILAAIM